MVRPRVAACEALPDREEHTLLPDSHSVGFAGFETNVNATVTLVVSTNAAYDAARNSKTSSKLLAALSFDCDGSAADIVMAGATGSAGAIACGMVAASGGAGRIRGGATGGNDGCGTATYACGIDGTETTVATPGRVGRPVTGAAHSASGRGGGAILGFGVKSGAGRSTAAGMGRAAVMMGGGMTWALAGSTRGGKTACATGTVGGQRRDGGSRQDDAGRPHLRLAEAVIADRRRTERRKRFRYVVDILTHARPSHAAECATSSVAIRDNNTRPAP